MANVINQYDQSAWSTYTPLSAQEILMPAMMMRERHDKLDEEYATINDELQKVAFIAEHENDPVIKQKYSNYINDLTASRDALMDKGLNSNSRRRMLDLRGRYQSEIQPINIGYQMKSQDINNYNQMIAKDPTYIGSNPANRTVSDYIGNGLQPFAQQGISGALLTKMANDTLAPLSQLDQVRTEDDLIKVLETAVGGEMIPQFMEIARRYGVKPGTEGHKMIMDGVKQNILKSTGMNNWANEEQLQQAMGYIDMAENATVGKTQYQMVNNSAYTIAAQKQALEEEAANKKKEEEDNLYESIRSMPISNVYEESKDFEKYNKILNKYFNKDGSPNKNLFIDGKLPEKGVQYKQNIGGGQSWNAGAGRFEEITLGDDLTELGIDLKDRSSTNIYKQLTDLKGKQIKLHNAYDLNPADKSKTMNRIVDLAIQKPEGNLANIVDSKGNNIDRDDFIEDLDENKETASIRYYPNKSKFIISTKEKNYYVDPHYFSEDFGIGITQMQKAINNSNLTDEERQEYTKKLYTSIINTILRGFNQGISNTNSKD